MMRSLEMELKELIRKKKEGSRRNGQSQSQHSQVNFPVMLGQQNNRKVLARCQSTDNIGKAIRIQQDNRIQRLQTQLTQKQTVIQQQLQTISSFERESRMLKGEVERYRQMVEDILQGQYKKAMASTPECKSLAASTNSIKQKPNPQCNRLEVKYAPVQEGSTPKIQHRQPLQKRSVVSPVSKQLTFESFKIKSPQKILNDQLTIKKISNTQTRSTTSTHTKQADISLVVETILTRSKRDLNSLRFKPKYDL